MGGPIDHTRDRAARWGVPAARRAAGRIRGATLFAEPSTPDRFREGLRRTSVHEADRDTLRERDKLARVRDGHATGGVAVPVFCDAWARCLSVDAAGALGA